jgi:hypothetical protein
MDPPQAPAIEAKVPIGSLTPFDGASLFNGKAVHIDHIPCLDNVEKTPVNPFGAHRA